jgi:hypothetical protein
VGQGSRKVSFQAVLNLPTVLFLLFLLLQKPGETIPHRLIRTSKLNVVEQHAKSGVPGDEVENHRQGQTGFKPHRGGGHPQAVKVEGSLKAIIGCDGDDGVGVDDGHIDGCATLVMYQLLTTREPSFLLILQKGLDEVRLKSDFADGLRVVPNEPDPYSCPYVEV